MIFDDFIFQRFTGKSILQNFRKGFAFDGAVDVVPLNIFVVKNKTVGGFLLNLFE